MDVLALVLQHDEQAVLCAVELALEDGVATKTHVLNVLHRLTDGGGAAAIIDAPHALVLRQEPRADIERYDALRIGRCAMRHDPASAALVVMLRGLKMFGMAQAVGDLAEQGAAAFEAAVPVQSQLRKAEMAEREVRSIACYTKAARFPAYKDLASLISLPARSTRPRSGSCIRANSPTGPTTSC